MKSPTHVSMQPSRSASGLSSTTEVKEAKAFGSTIAPAFGGGRRACPSLVEERRRFEGGRSAFTPLWWERVPNQSPEVGTSRMLSSASSLSGLATRSRPHGISSEHAWRTSQQQPQRQWNTCLYSNFDSSLITGRARRGYTNAASAPWGVISSSSASLSSSLSDQSRPAPSTAAPTGTQAEARAMRRANSHAPSPSLLLTYPAQTRC